MEEKQRLKPTNAGKYHDSFDIDCLDIDELIEVCIYVKENYGDISVRSFSGYEGSSGVYLECYHQSNNN